MSDCSPNAWAVPRHRDPLGEDGNELVLDAYIHPDLLDGVRTVRIRQVPGAVFHRRGKCTLTVEMEGYPCNDYRCSACGKMHNAPRAGAYCPRCGAFVTGVEHADRDGAYEETYEWMNED